MALSGDADTTSAEQLRELLTSQMRRAGRRLTVDVSDLRFADSAVVTILLFVAKALRERGAMVLVHPQEPVARMLGLLGVDQVIRVVKTPGA